MREDLISALLVLLSVLVVVFRKQLKKTFNGETSWRSKKLIFGMVVLAPFTFFFGAATLYSKAKFYMKYDTFAPQCLAQYDGGSAEILSVEHEMVAIYIKFRKTGTSDIFWCENNDGKIKFF